MPAEILGDAGFRTTGLWRNGWVEGYHGFDQGFEIYEKPVGRALPPSVRRENPTLKDTGSDTDSVDAAIEFLRIHGDERWFLYLHFMDVHEYLYDVDTAVFGTGYADIYDNSILRMNQTINQLLAHLSEVGLLDKTLIAISSDHGEAFGERGFEGHARKVYRESTQVPFILSFPFALEPGVVVEQRTRNVDIWPTLLDLLGLPAMEGIDGRSQVPEILAAARGETAPEGPPEIGYAHLDQNWGQRNRLRMPTVAVVEDGFRYVMTTAPGKTREELFDASADPREPIDVIDEQAEVAERLRKLADEYLDAKPPWSEEVETLELDEMQLNQLRALGYKVP
jgi:arylsulfatase A-like enzyme